MFVYYGNAGNRKITIIVINGNFLHEAILITTTIFSAAIAKLALGIITQLIKIHDTQCVKNLNTKLHNFHTNILR